MTRYIKHNSRTDMSFAPLPENPNKVGFTRVKLSDCNGTNIPVLDENGREVITQVYHVALNKSFFLVKCGITQQPINTLKAQHMVLNFLDKNNNLIAYWDESSIIFITTHQTTANNLAELLQVAHLGESTMSGERCLELTR